MRESGEFFILGKSEVDLYHGVADFMKVYPGDVSRNYPDGLINIVIYPKPSLLKLAARVEVDEAVIDMTEVEPLVIRDVIVRAKKKYRIWNR